jgi:hypothetical protein
LEDEKEEPKPRIQRREKTQKISCSTTN